MDATEIQLLDSLEKTHWWYQIRKLILVNKVTSFGSCLEILELGSASGGNTTRLLQLGHKVTRSQVSSIRI